MPNHVCYFSNAFSWPARKTGLSIAFQSASSEAAQIEAASCGGRFLEWSASHRIRRVVRQPWAMSMNRICQLVKPRWRRLNFTSVQIVCLE